MNVDKELECVWKGEFFKDDKHLTDLRREFLENLECNMNDMECDINASKDELERIQLIKKLFQWIPVPAYYFERKCNLGVFNARNNI